MAQNETAKKEFTEFFDLVKEMREAQKTYFKNREIAALKISKELERRVDYMLRNIDQLQLF